MPIPGPSPFQILLDNFTGAFPYDITAYQEGDLTWDRGTPDEQSSVNPGSLTLTLDNSDGRFSYGSGTYGIETDQQIRVIVDGVTRWTGFVQSWPVLWPGGAQTYSTVTVTAIDRLAMAARRTLRPAIVEDVLRNTPTALYQLAEDPGATLAGDSSGTSKPSLAIAGTGTAFTFGSGTGPADGLSCVSFLGGTFLRNSTLTTYWPASGALSLECWVATTMVPTAATRSTILQVDSANGLDAPTVWLQLTAAGKLYGAVGAGASLTSAASINDGLVHHIAVTLTAGGTMSIYLDGTGVGTTAGVTLPPTAGTRMSVAPSDWVDPGGGATVIVPFVGTVAHAAAFSTALAGVDIASHYAGVNDYTGETPAARLARVAAYMGMPTGTLDTAGSTTMGPASQDGKSVLDVIDEVAQAIQGAVYVNGTGSLTSRTGYTFTGDLTPDLSVDANYVTPDAVTEGDNAFVVNYATGKATGSENVFTATSPLSLGLRGMYRADYEWNVATDAQAVDRTNWKIGTYGGPNPRVPTLTLDVLSMTGATLTAALTLDVGKFLHVTGMPSQTPGGGVLDLFIAGISETITETTWTLRLNCVRHNLYEAWVLGDAIHGVLDATTKLYF